MMLYKGGVYLLPDLSQWPG